MTKIDPYRLDAGFEAVVVLSTVKRSKFYGVIGHALEPDALGSKTHALILKAVRAIVKDLGHAPSHESTLIQRVRRWVEDGNVTQEELDEVIDFFLDAPALPPESEVVSELAPVLRRRMEADAVRLAMDEYAKKGDFDAVQRIISKAKNLGRQDTSTGLRLGTSAFTEIERLSNMDRLPVGIEELDLGLDGGLPRGCQGVYVGGPGGGKSMFLSSLAASAVRRGYFVVAATLELNRAAWMARLMANLTGEPIAKIMSADFENTRRKIEKLYPTLGTFIVMDFPAKLTTMKDLCGWFDSCAEEEGSKPHVFIVDYADKCKSHLREDQGEYAGQNTVYETMRLFAAERSIWAWTASQPRRAAAKEKRRRIELDDLADSQGKARVADLVLTGNKTPDGEMIDYFVAKNRYGKSDFSVGPLPHDWACGRMTLTDG